MSITVREILNIEPFNKCELLSGQGGLSNSVKYTTTMELPDISPWLCRDLLLITTGYAIKDQPEALIPLMHGMHEAKCAGLLIKKEYIGSVPQEAIALSEQYNIPVIIMPDHIPFIALFVPLMNAISEKQDMQIQNNRLLMAIINGELRSKQEISVRANTLNWPQPPLRILVSEICEDENFPLQDSRNDARTLREHILQCIESRFMFRLKKSQIIATGDFFTIICPDTGTMEPLTSCVQESIQDVASTCHILLKTGVSDVICSYSEMKDAYYDARDALLIGKKLNDPGDIYPIQKYRLEQSFSQYRGNQRMQAYYDDTIGALTAYDLQNHAELLKTLEVLVQCLGNKTKAAERLYLHRNTLQYRIRKIEELTGISLNDGENLLRMAMILKIGTFL